MATGFGSSRELRWPWLLILARPPCWLGSLGRLQCLLLISLLIYPLWEIESTSEGHWGWREVMHGPDPCESFVTETSPVSEPVHPSVRVTCSA